MLPPPFLSDPTARGIVPSPESIHVVDDYLLAAGDRLDLAGSPGFKVEVKSDSALTLEIAGSAVLDGGTDHLRATGVLSTNSIHGDVTVAIDGTGELVVSNARRGGAAAGVTLIADTAAFSNAGLLQVTSDKGAASGASAQGDDAGATNSGLVEVHAKGQAYGLVAKGNLDALAQNDGTIDASGGQVQGMIMFAQGGDAINSGLVRVIGAQRTGVAIGVNEMAGSFANTGAVRAYGKGQAIGAYIQNPTGFSNAGHIEAASINGAHTSFGVVLFSGANGGILQNDGLIRGDMAVASQDIFGGVGAFAADDSVANDGRLFGDVRLGDGGDSVVNHGHIIGEVDLGLGVDSFDSRGGRVSGVVMGGGGDDSIVGSGQDDRLDGEIGFGSGISGQDVLRGMAGDDLLSGDPGDDTLIGGPGSDQLRGGAGADHFQFNRLSDSDFHFASVDLIADLESGDIIDLSRIDADTTTGGDQAFHLVASFTNHAGELEAVYNSVSDVTFFYGDVDGNGSPDLFIEATGDQTAFTGFAL